MRMIERVRLIEEIGAADGRRGVAKWVRGWRHLQWLQSAVDTMPELLHVVFDPTHYAELDYQAVAAQSAQWSVLFAFTVDFMGQRYAIRLTFQRYSSD